MINEIKEALEKISGPDAITPERVRAMRLEQEKRYEWYAYLLDELEKANTENERIQLVSNDWQDEYESVNRRLIELDRSSGETLDLLRKSSRTIITKDAEIFDLRTEHTAMKIVLEWVRDCREDLPEDPEQHEFAEAFFRAEDKAKYVLSKLQCTD